jgi:2-methylcitrate dehydratase PrpD
MDEMLNLISKNNITASQVERVEVGGDPANVRTLFHHQPTTGLEGKFSMEFCVGILLLDRKATLSEFTDAVVQRTDVQDMVRRVKFYADPGYNNDKSFVLTIRMKNGRVISARTGPAKGTPTNPMTFEEVADKFWGCTEFAKWPKQKADSVIEMVKSLENVPDVTHLAMALTN